MPVVPGEAPTATFDAVAADLTAAVTTSTMTFDDSLGGTLDTTAFVPPVESDMASIDSSDSCTGTNVVLKSVAGAAPSCECEDYYVGNPEWDAEAARWGGRWSQPNRLKFSSVQPLHHFYVFHLQPSPR